MNLPCEALVPPEYIGLWRRDSIEVNGEFDATTRVFWLQTGSLYADLRIPAGRPDFTAVASLDDCSREQLAWLAAQEGFAGCLNVVSDTCRWERAIDYQPTGVPDVGRMTFHPGGGVTEEGVLAEYREQWRAMEVEGPGRMAFTLAGPRRGLLVAAGDHFLFAQDRPVPLPGGTLAESVASPEPAVAARLLDFELSLGRIRGGGVPWTITLSTLPFREGEALFAQPPETAGTRIFARRPDGRAVTGDVVECTRDFRW